MQRVRVLIVLTATAVGGACAGALESDEAKVLGTVEFHGDPAVIVVPDTAGVGIGVPVSVRTYGGGCERIGPTEISLEADTTFVEPYDYTKKGVALICTMELKLFNHTTTLSWPTAGRRVVAIRGVVEPSGEVRTYLRTVVVH